MCAKISNNYKTTKWFLQKKQKMTKICLAMIFFCNFAAKIMKISALYRRFREWQKTPFHYQNHSDHVERCANCGTELGNYLLHLEMKPIKALLYADGTTVFLVLIGLLVDYHIIQRTWSRFVNSLRKCIRLMSKYRTEIEKKIRKTC